MKRSYLAAGLLCLALMLTGCAATRQFVPLPDQPKKVEDPSKGRIYVMRPASAFWEQAGMNISDSGRYVGETGPRGFICWERAPGATIITGKAEGISQVPLTVEAGGVYYLFQHLRAGWLEARNEMELLDEAQGREVLRRCHPPKVVAPPASGFSVSREKQPAQ